jgi:2-hydroxy-3-oxopropionate reductase
LYDGQLSRRSGFAQSKNATLSIMVGGPEATFNRVKPLFDVMGKNITLVGGNGDGQTTKVANQIIVALNIEAVAEALLFAAKAGADPAMGVALPNTATAQELFNACAAHGGAAWVHSAMVRALELLSNFEIGQKSAEASN